MERGDGEVTGSAEPAAGDHINRYLAVLTAGMSPAEAAKARETIIALDGFRAARPGADSREEELARRTKRAEGLPLEGRRRMLQEDALALEAGRLSGQVSGNALRVYLGEVQVTPEIKKETRRTVSRLTQLNAVLVGRFPNRADLHEEVSDAFLDAMFILGDGKGPLSNRLRKAVEERESPGKDG
jgi:hypothetical protein